MELQGEAYIARIPARFVTSTSLQYYVAAHKGGGKRSIVAEAGNKMTPNIVVIEGGRSPLASQTDTEIRSPYRTWIWVSGAAAVLMIGVGVTGFVLSADRESAIERWAKEKSCVNDCTGIPKRGFEDRARDWESQGKTFNLLGWIGVMLQLISLSVIVALILGRLIIATRQPSRQVIKGALDANIPARVGFKMSKAIESNMLLNQKGAENLLGSGDLLFKDIGEPVRLQAPYLVPEQRIELFQK